MRPLLLQCCPPLPGQLASKSTGKAETEYPLCQGPQNLHSLQQHNKKSFFSQNHGITYKCSKKVNRDQESKVVVGHAILSSTVQLNCTTQASSHCSFHVQKRFSFVRNIGSNLAHSTSACQGRYLTGTEALVLSYPRLSNKCLDIQSHAFEITMHFSAECTGALWRKPARELRTFRVHAQNGNPGLWKRFLLDPIDSKDFPIPVPDTEDEAEGDGDDSGQNSRDFGKGNSGEDWCKDDIDRMLADDASFAAWQQRNKARNELRESQKLGRDPGNVDWDWEDWLDDSWGDYNSYFGGKDRGWYSSQSDWEKGGLPRSPPKMPERGMSRTMKELLFRIFENEEEVKEDLAFEEKVFRFTSQTTVKFVAVLVFVPWLVAYVSHDFVIVPFLNRYVETVPLAAELLDLRESQKLNMVETLKLERQRVRFEAALGKAPPLSDEELLEHIREEALELRDELRLENRKAFGNIWSDILAGLTVFLLLVFNPEKVAIMRLTGNRLFTNISDTGKAFIIILLSDIFLGYHSESGWETVVEMFLEHYGFQVEQASIYIFVAIVPVAIDACFKLWVFRFLTMLSPSATATFREMKRH